MLQKQHNNDVERRQRDAPGERQAEQKIERNGGADHFRQIAGRDCNLAQHPQHDRRRPRVAVAAGLRQVASAGDAEPRRQRLQQDRHQIRQHDDAEERVAEASAACEVGRPIARIHVADGHEITGPRKGEELAPEACAFWHAD